MLLSHPIFRSGMERHYSHAGLSGQGMMPSEVSVGVLLIGIEPVQETQCTE